MTRTTPRWKRSALGLLTLTMLAAFLPLAPAANAAAGNALQLNGTSQYVTFGAAPGLGATQFTLEVWFNRTGTGDGIDTGTNGLTSAIPLLTKGRGQAETPANLNMNYFLGIDTATNRLAVDFEDKAAGANHPFMGNTAVTSNVWHHAAATFDATNGWRIYLDGVLDGSSGQINAVPESISIQHAALGTAMTSTGAADGFFAGTIDEGRVWNSARTLSQIQSTKDQEITAPQTGLLGRWGLNEASGTTAADTSSSAINGTVVGSPTRVAGFPNVSVCGTGACALDLNGTSQYAALGAASDLRLSQFTLELWFRRTGTGVGTDTGNGGVPDVVPLIAKGRAHDETQANDINYIFGIDQSSGQLVADFEEAQTGAAPSQNHPITGTTVIAADGTWHHAAATYDGNNWKLYLDGTLDGQLAVNQPVDNLNNIVTTIGSARRSDNSASGFFAGSIDEVRIWNTARTQVDIQAAKNTEITAATPGLVGRYGLNEGSGTVVGASAGTTVAGTTVGAPGWTTGFVPPVPPCTPGACGLQFDGTNDYVTFGAAPGLGLTQFTLETWFKRTGTGVGTGTGSGGITSAVPLVTKGRSENDTPANQNMNYFLGIDTATNKLAVDFEDKASGLNHPLVANTTITNNVWHHAAATFDATNGWRVYLDGVLDGSTGQINAVPESISIQHAGLGSAMNSSGVAAGFFAGQLDEARIWNSARTPAQISAGMNTPISVPTAGLVARWGMDAGTGSAIVDSSGNAFSGVATGGPTWVNGAPFTGGDIAPDEPALVAPGNGSTNQSQSPTLDVTVDDDDDEPVDVTFYGRPLGGATPPDFTIGVLPDTQNYSASSTLEAIYRQQTQWIVDTRAAMNTVFVTHVGDIVNTQTTEAEWIRADAAQDILDNNAVPNAVTPGNHDITTAGVATFYDQYFPPSRYEANPWYGGYLGDPSDAIADPASRLNKDNYQLFEVGSLKFLMVSIEVGMPQYSVDWARSVLEAYPDRRAIITTHAFIDPNANRPTSAVHRPDGLSATTVWNQLISQECNVFLVINGHYHGEARRVDNNSCGQPVIQVLSDYQDDPNGGDGWMRMMTFKPELNRIDTITYSPSRNGGAGDYDTDAQSQFSLSYDMSGNPFQQLGTATGVAPGGHATLPWSGLEPQTDYEWYAVASDGTLSTQSQTWTFKTGGVAPQPPVVDSASVTPSTLQSRDTASVQVSAHDPEGQPITYSFQWLKNGVVIPGEITSTLNLAPAGVGDKGDAISARIVASDGSLSSAPFTTAPVVIENAAPRVTSLSLNTALPNTDQTLTATAPKADADGDTVTLTYVWRVNGATQQTTVTTSVTDTFDLSQPGHGDGGDAVSVTATPNDGTVDGNAKVANATVQGAPPVNHPPTADPQSVSTARNTAKGILLTGSDPDNNPLVYSIVTSPAHGTISGNGANRTYTPTQGYTGPDSFTFKVYDGFVDSAPATVTINVVQGSAVSITDNAFTKANLKVTQGATVTWTNNGSTTHNVHDSSGMDAFISPTLSPTNTFAFTFVGAGTYNYQDGLHPSATGKIKVPLLVSPAGGTTSTAFTVTWAAATPPAGYGFDVQIKRGTAKWANWQIDETTTLSDVFTPDAGAGTYKFRARLDKLADNTMSAWSAVVTVNVT